MGIGRVTPANAKFICRKLLQDAELFSADVSRRKT
jgi:hypothetical protein